MVAPTRYASRRDSFKQRTSELSRENLSVHVCPNHPRGSASAATSTLQTLKVPSIQILKSESWRRFGMVLYYLASLFVCTGFRKASSGGTRLLKDRKYRETQLEPSTCAFIGEATRNPPIAAAQFCRHSHQGARRNRRSPGNKSLENE